MLHFTSYFMATDCSIVSRQPFKQRVTKRKIETVHLLKESQIF